LKKALLLGLGIAAAVWLAWPYFTLYRIGKAINDGDAAALEQHVSWPAVRQGIKDDLNALFVGELAKAEGSSNPFAQFAANMVPALIERSASLIGPSSFLIMLRKGAAQHGVKRSERCQGEDKA
jgi:hypothetical protein